ncbi:MAG: choline dehydrogenase [Alphaproteobacteria bacterium]|nr:choline dehydrogenase [Alphaproteobacteria bacterium]MBU2082809.1 choline dehydrogenase [Alphaproteobacteria bacterium]MBU2142899.1 choline dehydrogenase [Alphaproteobacteria bacterium]MBU2197930.1 choline dehydrogenase [Alphaproteobacteria bacterium]
METYDYIIVGAGSGGCALANRLSADPAIKVCLIEAGKKDNALMVRMPAGVGSLIKQANDHNWGFYTEAQKNMNGRKLYWPRGKGWGGSSSINGMVYIRGHAGDYDQWAQMGLKGWSYADVLPYFKRSEAYEGGDNAFHGGAGPLRVSESPMSSPIYRAFIQAGEQAGYKLTDDFNGADQEGFGRYQRTIHKGERWSASFGYLRPIEGVRPNLTVISTGLVTRVLIENGRATGVEVVEGKGALTQQILADKEVVLCAGAVQSPQILMLSGIGNPEHLDRFGIKATVKSPGVGQNLQDHLDVTVIHEMTQPVSAYSMQKGVKKLGVGLQYLYNQTGAGADNFLQAGAFLNSREGLSMPDIQLHLVNAIMMDHGNHDPKKDGFTVHACQLRPESRGTVCLASADPFAHPAIDPNYLATEEDRRVMREAVKMVREVCGQSALNALRGNEILPGASVETDDDIDSFIRRTGETIYHPVGTVAMGTSESSPVDPELRVRGVDGLRVVDASVMPTLIGGNTNAPTIMIAEKAADMMLSKRALAREESLTPA